MYRPRVLLADDHPMMLEGLKKLLEPSCEVVGRVADGRALLAAAERLRPDLVVTDISMPELDGLAATHRLQAAHPGLRVLVLSFHAEHSWVTAAFEAGASGYLTKTSAPEEIERAVHDVLEGQFFVSSAVTQGMVAAAAQPLSGSGFCGFAFTEEVLAITEEQAAECVDFLRAKAAAAGVTCGTTPPQPPED